MEAVPQMKHNVRRRMEFIEFCLIWDGRVGRKRLKEQFEISLQQATNDLNGYLDATLDSMRYDPRKKAYVRTASFKPHFTLGKSQDYLEQLQSHALGFRNADHLWLEKFPKVATAFLPTRDVATKILQDVLRAIEEQQSFEMLYVSLREKDQVGRRVTPHSLGTDGRRWHMRAFDHTKGRFADFVLSRIRKIFKFESSDIDGTTDDVWHNLIELRLEPDPRLDPDVRASMAAEYQMRDGVLIKQMSQAMLFYFLRQYGFNPVPAEGGPIKNESSYHLSLCDHAEVERLLERREGQ